MLESKRKLTNKKHHEISNQIHVIVEYTQINTKLAKSMKYM